MGAAPLRPSGDASFTTTSSPTATGALAETATRRPGRNLGHIELPTMVTA